MMNTLFTNIIGYTDLKEIIEGSIENNTKVHWLFHGPPASAKSMFLLEMEDKLSGAILTVGSRTSNVGLHDMLLQKRPKYLLFDELDKASKTVHNSLLLVLETGRIVVTLKTYQIDEYIDMTVFATANRLDKVPEEVLSRFQLLEFPAYTEEEFMNICKSYIAHREGIKPKLATYIGEHVWNFMEIRDVRQVIRIARLAKTKERVDLVIKVLKKYHQPCIRYGHTTKRDFLENVLRFGDGDVVVRE